MSETIDVGNGGRRGEQGFTLIEALVAILILAVGLVAITNLMIVAAASNSAGNHTTATAAAASEVMERIKGVPFNSLALATMPTDSLTTDRGSITNCQDSTSQNCVIAGNFNAIKAFPGVGRVRTRWQITAVDGQTLFIRVRAESLAPLMGSRSRAEFTTFRSCTSVTTGCPNP